jgi:GNAT superfamily N-acetyltransferase
MTIKLATKKEEIEFCKDVILQFRTNLDKDTYLDQVLDMMDEGFQLYYIPGDGNDRAAAFTGIRTYGMLRTGSMIYIDDLFTLPEYRGRGYAGALLDHVSGIAKRAGILSVHLDTGYSLHEAHRLYLKKGYFFAAHHLAQRITL